MPRSNRRQEQFGRRGNPQGNQSRGGGFEQTGTGYRYDDQQRRGYEQQRGESGGRDRPGQQDWRQSSERSRYGEGRTYGQDSGQESRYGRGEHEDTPRGMGQQNWSSHGYPESYRNFEESGREGADWNREDESRYGRGSQDWDYRPERDYEGNEPGDYATGSTSRFGSSQRFGGSGPQGDYGSGAYGQGRSQGSSGQMRQGSFGGGGSRQSGQEGGREYQSGSQQYGGGSKGSFAGHGPQGYKRSDERITEDINEELTQDPDIDATNISLEVQNGEVTLKGTVPDRETKRRAEDIAESCSGVKEVQNQLRVKREGVTEPNFGSQSERGDKSGDKRSNRQQIAS